MVENPEGNKENPMNEMTLREERDFITAINDTITSLVVVLDKDGRILRYNQACERITGYTFSQVQGRYYWDVFCLEEEKELYKSFFANLKPSHCPCEVETHLENRQGIWHSIQWVYSMITDQDGECKYYVFTGTDITEQKKTEDELSAIGERYRSLIHAVPVAVISLNAEYCIERWSAAAERILGWPEREVQGKDIAKVIRDRDQRLKSLCQQVLQRRLFENEELYCYRKDGLPVYLNLSIAPISRHNGDMVGIVIVANDRTEEKKAEIALRQSEERYRTLFEEAINIIIVVDEQGQYVDANGAALSFLEKGKDELYKEDKCCLLPADILTSLQRGKKNMLPQTLEQEYTVHGHTKTLLLNIVPLELAGKTFFYGIGQDITERKLQEEKIHYMSFHDTLTGLYNRSYMEEEMERLDTSRQLPLSVIMVDVNGLKLVNDAYGHVLGDELLITSAQILRQCCRQEDIIARWGGDEFIILLPQTSKEAGEAIMQRILKGCQKTYVGIMPLSMAMGLATKTAAIQDLETILQRAEERMYTHKLSESRKGRSVMIKALLETLEKNTDETEEHAWNMQHLGFLLGEKIGLGSTELERLTLLIPIHDIGKITIPKIVFEKEGPLDAAEWELIYRHPETGYRIARSAEEFILVAGEILAHHECWDGSGYPEGIKGEEIPLLARILALIDAYDVMTRGRRYKRAFSQKEAREEIRRCAGRQFDPYLAEKFLEVLDDLQR